MWFWFWWLIQTWKLDNQSAVMYGQAPKLIKKVKIAFQNHFNHSITQYSKCTFNVHRSRLRVINMFNIIQYFTRVVENMTLSVRLKIYDYCDWQQFYHQVNGREVYEEMFESCFLCVLVPRSHFTGLFARNNLQRWQLCFSSLPSLSFSLLLYPVKSQLLFFVGFERFFGSVLF